LAAVAKPRMLEIEKKVEPLLKDLKEKAQKAIATVPAA
jgi:hypothetical protein